LDRSEVALVIPALNESQTIASVVSSISKYGAPIVVDDGSIDSTGAVAEKAGAVVVEHVFNRGYDAALNSGVKKAFDSGFNYVVTLDADGQHDPRFIDRFLEEFDKGSQLVVGKRPSRPRIAESVFAGYSNYFYGIDDPLCGMKGYSRALYESLGYVDSFQSIGTELAIYAAKEGFNVSQVSVEILQRQGKPRFGSGLRANLKILRAMILNMAKRY
jgi:glycosyltransferase involved in cell wall biosynthesis